jgi:hypothetical protein
MFMRHQGVSLILATGGTAMVRAAYSSGTPAIGVGSGNVPALVCADADPVAAAAAVVESKSFDHGIICGSEDNLVVDAAVAGRSWPPGGRRGGGLHPRGGRTGRRPRLRPRRRAPAARGPRPGRRGDRGRRRGPPRPAGPGAGPARALERADGPLGREKLAPLLSLFTVDGTGQALRSARRCWPARAPATRGHPHRRPGPPAALRRGGPGQPRPGQRPGHHGCIGVGNGLTPSLTLGCGTFGGNSTTDNVTYTNLLNVKRLARPFI